jgi:hypothetical protein
MLKIIQDIEDEFVAAKDKIGAMLGAAKVKACNATTLVENDIKDAEAKAFSSIDNVDITLGQAFAMGARWAADHIATQTAPVVPTGDIPQGEDPAAGEPNVAPGEEAQAGAETAAPVQPQA